MDDRSGQPETSQPDEEGTGKPEGRGPLVWVPWSLVAGAAASAVVLAEVFRRFLTGGADTVYFGSYVSEETLRTRIDFTFSVRFRLLWATVAVPEALLASSLALVALAALIAAGRPGWLVPSRWAGRVAAGAAALTAVESALCLVMLFDLTNEPLSEPFGNLQRTYLLPNTGGLLQIAPVLALLAVTTVLSLASALVLWRVQDRRPDTADTTDTANTAGPVPVDPVDPAPTGAASGAPPGATGETVLPPAPDEARDEAGDRVSGGAPATPVHAVPKLPAEQLEAYRRPRA
ncbi:hypothetical protein [Kineococcus radiotolerans]|uniref:Uncharacterized protein n=1 Tax=Kineococcus radiotolerans (strain ATCC BAA-149 / DSM 14245 / SRS30216) TaxID=266940 RepID=A6WB49_KINRD|nr:hypothetical protein [Kineococcus radiotolerans]ABS04038.1 hypothetical protein Krad_2563 [Kineococcus radiotolerans SRS30216 = ATCC BAA-149]